MADSISTIAPTYQGHRRDARRLTSTADVCDGWRQSCAQSIQRGGHLRSRQLTRWSVGYSVRQSRGVTSPTDTDGTNNIWLAGGYDVPAILRPRLEIFNCPQVSPTPSAYGNTDTTPSATPTPTATADIHADPASADAKAAPDAVSASLTAGE